MLEIINKFYVKVKELKLKNQQRQWLQLQLLFQKIK